MTYLPDNPSQQSRLADIRNRNNLKEIRQEVKNTVEETSGDQSRKLKKTVNKFTSILLKKMFESMKETIPETGFIDGGRAEDIFTDMYYKEISEMGSKQQTFSNINRLLYQQLERKK